MRTSWLGLSIAVTLLGACGDDGGAKPDASVGNHPPTVTALQLTTNEDTPVSGTIAATDADGDALAFTFTTPAHGAVTMSGTMVTYTPAANYNGTDTFAVTVMDGQTGTTANVDIAIAAVNDPPVAVADSLAGTEDTAFAFPTSMVLGNDTDVEGDTLSVTAVGNPHHGTVVLAGQTITFTPTANFSGAADFEYTVSDGTDTATGVVTIAFGSVNDAPIAVDDTATTPEDVNLVVTGATLVANDTDVDGNTLTVTAVSNPTHGTVALAAGSVTFTPALNYNGPASFDYTVSDGTLTDTGSVAVTVTPVNDAPIAVDDVASTNEDTALDLQASELLANDTDADLQTLTVTAVSGATHGTVVLAGTTITFTPVANYFGPATFNYTVSDGSLTDTGAVTITVIGVPDAPIAVDDTRTVQSDVTATIPTAVLLANDTDADGDVLAITAVANATHGVATLVGASITFTPTGGYLGPASFDYTVSDGTLTDTGSVAITVTNVPVCGDGVVGGTEACDDGNNTSGDGCTSACAKETGYDCAGSPSVCTPHCGDHLKVGNEQCDDGNAVETDGCTSQCKTGVVCTLATHAMGTGFAVDPATGHCYVEFADNTNYGGADIACRQEGGHLATISTAGEQAAIASVQGTDSPWIGATDDPINTTDNIFLWVTQEPFGYTNFATGEPDDDASTGGNGNCLHATAGGGGTWGDTNCSLDTFVVGRVCEIEPVPCGDGVQELGETCDDHNTTAGDGCSATCQIEPLASFSFTGRLGNEVSVPADLVNLTALASAPVISRGAGVSPSGAAGAFSSNGWTTATTLDVTDYYTITVTPAAGKTLTLTRLELDESRSATGIANWVVRSSLDSFATDLSAFTVPDVTTARTNEATPLGAAFSALTAPVEFRIYGFHAEAATGTWRVDNVEIYGSAQ